MLKPLNKDVPSYGLYGESLVNTEPGLVHIEDISDRSKELDWVISAHRHAQLMQILCIFEGSAEVKLDGKASELGQNCFVTIPSSVVHGFKFEPNIKGFVLTLDNSIIDPDRSTAFKHIINQHQPEVIQAQISDPEYQRFLQYAELIKQEANQQRHDQNDAMTALAQLAVISVYRMIETQQINNIRGEEKSHTLTRFRQLLDEHYREHWSVNQYADQLHVSVSTLSRLCQNFAGESPKAIIQKRILADARRRLMYTRQSIEYIAHNLGFKDQAYFSRFFKKIQGQTPAAYRKLMYR
jgi:AraC family transcriptional activator of pobA